MEPRKERMLLSAWEVTSMEAMHLSDIPWITSSLTLALEGYTLMLK